jgi:DNA-binding NarL/FixJ family response regulator
MPRFFFAGAIGAALAYFFDPDNGRKRRHVAADKAGKYFRQASRQAQGAAAQAQGLKAKATHLKEQEKDQPVRPESLTQRETDILALLSEGKSNREIARALFLSEKTVKAHLAAVFRKLGVANRTQAAMAAVGMGMGPWRKQAMDDDDEPMAGQRQVGTWRS